MAAHAKCRTRLHVLSLIGVWLTLAWYMHGHGMPAATAASVVNDVNNMLRDTTTEMQSSHIVGHNGGYRYGSNGDSNKIAQPPRSMDSNLINANANGELLRFVNDRESDIVDEADDNEDDAENAEVQSDEDEDVAGSSQVNFMDINGKRLPVEAQVRLLSKQLNALLTHRREDYEILESNLRKSLRINAAANTNTDIRNELEQLRHEVKTLRDNHSNGNRERLTVEWLQQSVSEIRKQLIELQQIASNTVRDVHLHKENYEDLATIRNDFQQLKLELAAVRERQQKTDVYVQELREEVMQQEEEFKRLLHNNELNKHHHKNNQHNHNNNHNNNNSSSSNENPTAVADVPDDAGHEMNTAAGRDNNESAEQLSESSTELLADHKRRHCRFQHEQLRQLHVAQHSLKRQLNELKYSRISDRIRNIEIEQHRIAGANFNLSRQIATFDKLHTSMLQLLEDVEELQNKMDKNVPALRHEISKLEFTQAQLTSGQNLVREEGKNTALSLQAMAVSVNKLLEERQTAKQVTQHVAQLQMDFDKLKTIVEHVQRSVKHHRHASEEKQLNGIDKMHNEQSEAYAISTQDAESLVTKLENVEEQYESILNKLPRDCSEIKADSLTTDGIYLIAPTAQHKPIMTHCAADGWTTVQRRYDGSADFNRSWVEYAAGFGSPAGEFWIGNEQLHQLTLNNCTSLRIEMQDIYDNSWVAEYEQFYISTRDDGYRLHIDGYSGNASDALSYQQGMQFSAIDDDRDISQTHCAANYEGGWWFSHCQHANLNGRYNLGLTWFDAARNEWIAVKSSQMSIKRKSAAVCEYVAANAKAVAESSATTILSSGGALTMPTTTTATVTIPTTIQTLTIA